jgi:membrane protease YdiL (CAAX protease family)
MNQMHEKNQLRPLSWLPSLTILFIIASIQYITHYLLIPHFTKTTGQPYLVGYLIGWISTVGIIFVASIIAYKIEGNKFFAPHPAFPPDMSPQGAANIKQGILFGMILKGNWWIIIAYFIGWVLNILGEEFWYRGWMLPKQEVAIGKFAWILNGVVFTFQHWMQPWNFLVILPGALFMSFVLQMRKNTWIGIIQHGLLNMALFIHVIRGVMG